MPSLQCTIHPVPAILKNDIECLRIVESRDEDAVAFNVAPYGVPGLVFHQNNGRSAIENITTHTKRTPHVPPLFLYGPGTEPSVMNYKSGSSTTTHVIFKPHALKTLLGINASALTNGWTDLHEFSAGNLASQLLEAQNAQERLMLLTRFLVAQSQNEKPRDPLIEASLHFIHQHMGAVHVKDVLDFVYLSERQFERRFIQTVGLSPHVYIRVKRFNAAIRLIKNRQFARLTDVASALNFSDQSHLIRDIKTFSGMTPKHLAQQMEGFYHDQAGYSSLGT